jgi:hypothetical protein
MEVDTLDAMVLAIIILAALATLVMRHFVLKLIAAYDPQLVALMAEVVEASMKLDLCKTQDNDPYDFIADRNAGEELICALGRLRDHLEKRG